MKLYTRGVALGGFMGSGKSTVGLSLSTRLGMPFVDMDVVLTERFGPIPDQFAQDGEAVFRMRERGLVAELCDGRVRVVATGGGVWVDPENRSALGLHYTTVVLHAPLSVLAQRVGSATGRPLWGDDVASRFRQRESAYSDADLSLDTSLNDLDTIQELIISHMNCGPDSQE